MYVELVEKKKIERMESKRRKPRNQFLIAKERNVCDETTAKERSKLQPSSDFIYPVLALEGASNSVFH